MESKIGFGEMAEPSTKPMTKERWQVVLVSSMGDDERPVRSYEKEREARMERDKLHRTKIVQGYTYCVKKIMVSK